MEGWMDRWENGLFGLIGGLVGGWIGWLNGLGYGRVGGGMGGRVECVDGWRGRWKGVGGRV